jgi:hypothetical protein
VLLEAGLGIGLVTVRDERYRITKTAHYLLHDAMTRANMDFTHDVNYLGLFDLESSVRDGAPNGLKRFGSWPTVYRALAHLPPTVRQSWFAFDQFYSDNAFSASLPLVFAHRPRTLLDIGGNTGKWAQTVLRYDPEVHVTLADLPGQLRMAQKNLRSAGLSDRASFLEADMLDANSGLSGTYDAIWMSQFLDCFSEAQIVTILRSCVPAMTENGRVYILEPFWDRQRFATAAFCLQQTSLYFTAIANGNSQMYDSRVFLRCIDQAGLTVTEQHDGLGIGHTLLSCQPRGR